MGKVQEQVWRLRVQLPKCPARAPEWVLFVDLAANFLCQDPRYLVRYLWNRLPIFLASHIPADTW
jgi:hypothetical protein